MTRYDKEASINNLHALVLTNPARYDDHCTHINLTKNTHYIWFCILIVVVKFLFKDCKCTVTSAALLTRKS